ncbi:MAG: GDSL-type esterase/lipase family protein [Microscillaceae bacterium]|nr:GDSL-type esterase/lipase family protein [Microscillaceae bacterium]
MSSQNKLFTQIFVFSLLLNVAGIAYVGLYIMSYRAGISKNINSYLEAYYQRKKEHFETLPNRKGEVVFLGNSITDACPWAELFQNPQIINRGISGDNSQGIRARLYEILESEPSQIFLMMGTNDLAKGKTPDQILSDFEEIFKEVALKSPYTQVFVQSLLPVNPQKGERLRKNEDIQILNQRLEALCVRQKVGFIDLHQAMTLQGVLNPDFSNDGLHLNGAGYQTWKKILEPFVKKPRNAGDKNDTRPDQAEDQPGGAEEDKDQKRTAPKPDTTLRSI